MFLQKFLNFKNIIHNYINLSKIENKYYNLVSLPFKLIFSFIIVNIAQIIGMKKTLLYLVDKMNILFAVRYLSLNNKVFIANNLPDINLNINNKLDKKQIKKLNNLQKNGYVYLGKIFKKKFCQNYIKTLDNKYYFNSQQPLQSNGKLYKFRLKSKTKSIYSTFLHSKILNKKIINNVLDKRSLENLVMHYLSFKPEVYSALTWLNLPSNKKHYVQHLHRDYDDFKFLVLIIYWNDVGKKNGATSFVSGSHKFNNKNKIKFLTGKAGSAFLIDSYGLHSGTKLLKGERFSTWIRFGRKFNAATVQDGRATS
jgi:hypothetical protein